METRVCKDCGIEKPLDNFSMTPYGGYHKRTCKECVIKNRPVAVPKVKVLTPKFVDHKCPGCGVIFPLPRKQVFRAKYGKQFYHDPMCYRRTKNNPFNRRDM